MKMMNEIDELVSNGRVQGVIARGYDNVAETFIHNFNSEGEIGAGCCVFFEGDKVVDLWGGMSNKTQAWSADTLVTVFSCTKAATALCAHKLIESGALDLDALVGDFWPEFAQAGKEKATVRMLLNHTVGLPAFRAPLKPDAFIDWEYMTRKLEEEAPFWEPGTATGYHMISFGWTVGELVRRVSGLSLGAYFKREFADPLEAEFYIGLPAEHNERTAKSVSATPEAGMLEGDFIRQALKKGTVSQLALSNTGGWNPNLFSNRAAQIGGAGGISNARGLATLFSPLAIGGEVAGRRYFLPNTIDQMGRESTRTSRDKTLCVPTRFALGFMKSMDNRNYTVHNQDSVLWGDSAFGHVGAGGSVVFADPKESFSFGYAMNKAGMGVLLNKRGQGLIDATYQAIAGATPY